MNTLETIGIIIGIVIAFFLLIAIIVVPSILINGSAYSDICEEKGIENIWRCGWIAPDFGTELDVRYQQN